MLTDATRARIASIEDGWAAGQAPPSAIRPPVLAQATPAPSPAATPAPAPVAAAAPPRPRALSEVLAETTEDSVEVRLDSVSDGVEVRLDSVESSAIELVDDDEDEDGDSVGAEVLSLLTPMPLPAPPPTPLSVPASRPPASLLPAAPKPKIEAVEVELRDDDSAILVGTETLVPGMEPEPHDATVFDPRSEMPVVTMTEQIVGLDDLKKKGLLHDVGYAVLELVRAFRGRRELTEIRDRLEVERDARRRRLLDVARVTLADVRFEHPTVVRARARLAEIEVERSRLQAAVRTAADEAGRTDVERKDNSDAAQQRDARLASDLEKLEAELKPLEADAVQKRKNLDAIKAGLTAAEKRIRVLEKKVTTAKTREEGLAVEADLAASRAEREGLGRDAPVVVTALGELEPRIEKLRTQRDALRDEQRKNKSDASQRADEDGATLKSAQERVDECERALREANLTRDEEILLLGEALDRERPTGFASRLRPADEHAVAIAVLERRALEIANASSAVDRGSLYRGLAVVSIGLVALAAFLALALR